MLPQGHITNAYFAPERSFIDLLAAAARRGVDDRILTAGARTDVNVVRHAGGASYGTLLEAGVRVFEWQPSTLTGLHSTIRRQMDQIFLDDLRHAEEITLTTFRQRSWWARLAERAAKLVTRLL
jgi:cardiolipin synthase